MGPTAVGSSQRDRQATCREVAWDLLLWVPARETSRPLFLHRKSAGQFTCGFMKPSLPALPRVDCEVMEPHTWRTGNYLALILTFQPTTPRPGACAVSAFMYWLLQAIPLRIGGTAASFCRPVLCALVAQLPAVTFKGSAHSAIQVSFVTLP